MKVRVFIADDEELARLKLHDLLGSIPGVEVCGEARDGLETIKQVKKLKPDILLLDIQMPGKDGFQVLRTLKTPPQVIFTTAYDQYAVKAFEVETVDYLLKPFGKERLKKAVDRARKRMEEGTKPVPDIMELIENIKGGKKQYRVKFSSLKRGKVVMLDKNDITYFLLEDTILFAYSGEDRYPIKGNLETLEKEIDPDKFFRCHRSAIVNLDHIREIRPMFKNNYEIVLDDPGSTCIPLSRRRAKILRDRYPW